MRPDEGRIQVTTMEKNLTANKSFDMRDILAILMNQKWLIIIPVIICSIVAYGGSYYLHPKYNSSLIIWIDKPVSVSRELMSIIGSEGYRRETGDDRRRRLAALENEITSQTYIYQLIRDLNLDNDPDITRRAAKMREDNPEFSIEKLKYNLLLDQLRDNLSIRYVGADQILLQVESTDPVLARDIVTHLATIMEAEKTKYDLEKILDNQNFADLQLQKTEFFYRQEIDSLTRAQARLSELRLPESISSEANRREIRLDIDRTEGEIKDLRSRLENIRAELTELDLDRSRLKFTDSLVRLRTDIDGEAVSLADLMERYPWATENVININIRLNDYMKTLNSEIADLVDEQYGSYPAEQRQLLTDFFVIQESADILGSKRNQLQLSYDRMIERIDQLPRLEAELTELERRVEEARRYRDAFKSEETTVEILSEQAKERTKYKVIEPARVPLEPFWPDRRRIGIMGLVLGLVIGGAAALLRELLDSSFKQVEDVEEALGLPVIAVIPKIEKLKIR
jgi:uncharacterized protein involved in exopolysaccharide biosynthesis